MDETHILKILNWAVERISFLSDLVTKDMEFLWVIPTVENFNKNDSQILNAFKIFFESIENIDAGEINKLCRSFCKENSIQFGVFMKMIRHVLTGLKVRIMVLTY